jgi:hypothetical protein
VPRAQSEQAESPADEYLPATQLVQLVEPVALDELFPESQLVHDEAAADPA